MLLFLVVGPFWLSNFRRNPILQCKNINRCIWKGFCFHLDMKHPFTNTRLSLFSNSRFLKYTANEHFQNCPKVILTTDFCMRKVLAMEVTMSKLFAANFTAVGIQNYHKPLFLTPFGTIPYLCIRLNFKLHKNNIFYHMMPLFSG